MVTSSLQKDACTPNPSSVATALSWLPISISINEKPSITEPHFDPSSAMRNLFAYRIIKDNGVNSIIFRPGEYSTNYEGMLRELGVDLLRIPSPARSDSAILHEAQGYFEKPQKLTWRLPIRSFDDHLENLDSKGRNRLKSKLAKSAAVSMKLTPLTTENFKIFYELYKQGVLAKERGRQTLSFDWADKKDSLSQYQLLLYRTGSGKQIIGGAIIKSDPGLLLVTIAYAAYLPDSRPHDLGVRTFVEVMKHAMDKGYSELSHGQDSNLYGHYLSPGLFEFKAGLGFTPHAAGKNEIIKILNPEAFSGEIVFLKRKHVGEVAIQLLSDNPRRIVAPKGLDICIDSFVRELKPHKYPSLLTLPLLVRDAGDEGGAILEDLLTSSEQLSDKKFWVETFMPKGASSDPVWRAIKLTQFLDGKGIGSLEHAIEYVQNSHTKLSSESVKLDSEVLARLMNPDMYLRLAASLRAAHPVDFWHDAISCLTVSLNLPSTVLDRVLAYWEDGMLTSFFDSIHKMCGEEMLSSVLSELNGLVPLTMHLERLSEFEPSQAPIPHDPITFDDLNWHQYFEPNNAREGLVCLNQLRDAYIRSQLHSTGSLNRSERVFCATIGAAATIHAVTQAMRLADGRELSTGDMGIQGDYGLAKRIMQLHQELSSLVCHSYTRPQLSHTEQDFVTVAHFDHIYVRRNLVRLLAEASIDGAEVPVWGKPVNQVLVEVFHSLSNNQVARLLNCAEVKFRDSPLVTSAIARLREQLQERHEPRSEQQLPELGLDPNLANQISKDFWVGGIRFNDRAAMMQLLNLYSSFLGIGEVTGTSELVYVAAREGKIDLILGDGMFEVILSAVRNPDGAHVFLNHLFYHPESPVTAQHLYDALTAWHSGSGIELAHLVGLIRCLCIPETKQIALEKMRSITAITSNGSSELETEKTLKVACQKIAYVAASREEVDEILRGLQKRITDERSEMPFFAKLTIRESLSSLLALREQLGLGQQGFWNELNQFAQRDPESVYSLMKFWLSDDAFVKRYLLMQEVGQLPTIIMEVSQLTKIIMQASSPTEALGSFEDGNWKYVALDFAGLDQPTPTIEAFMSARINIRAADFDEELEYINWVLSHPKLVFADTLPSPFLSAVARIGQWREEVKAKLIDLAAEKLRSVPFDNCQHFRDLEEIIERLDHLGQDRLRERLINNASFLNSHPWEAYGYSPAVVEKLRTFCQHPNFDSRRAQLLVSFLMSHNGSPIYRFWISRLILSAPEGESDNLVRLMRYWQSLSTEGQASFLTIRVEDLLGEIKLRVSKQTSANSLKKLAAYVEASKENGQLDEKSSARLEQLSQYRELFVTFASAQNDDTKEKARNALHTRLIEEFPPIVDPNEEERKLVEHQFNFFVRKIYSDEGSRHRVGDFLRNNQELLRSSGIIDRFVQFSGFSDPKGTRMLKQVLWAYSDPQQARIIKINRPDLGGKETLHFDLFGKFDKLNTLLCECGIDQNRVDSFINKWRQLWYFDGSSRANRGEDQSALRFSSSHDLERWCKHGEEPVLSCQRLSSRAGNMFPNNWNHQFGANPNASGRPLARILLPQLKLGEFRIDGQLISRNVLEVTVKIRDGEAKLALLVERMHKRDSRATPAEFNRLIDEFATWLGIDLQDIYYADLSPDDYPPPLPEEFRIYRDYFRTDR
jgi:hypothetical protein